jgi:hypothetical protein
MRAPQLYKYIRDVLRVSKGDADRNAPALSALCVYLAEHTIIKERSPVGIDEIVTQVYGRPLNDASAYAALKRSVTRIRAAFENHFAGTRPSKKAPHLRLEGGKRGYQLTIEPPLRISVRRTVPLEPLSLPVFPVTRIRVEMQRNEVTSFEIVAMNAKACEYYGLKRGSNELIGASLQTLLARLQAWVDQPDFERLVADQRRAGRQFAAEKYAVATVPVRFNNTHPYDAFKNRSFLSVMTDAKPRHVAKGTEVFFAVVLYLDLDWAKDI